MPYVMPIMHAAKALAVTLVVAPAAAGTVGQWKQNEPGAWLFTDGTQALKGFALSGAHTSRRAELAKRVV